MSATLDFLSGALASTLRAISFAYDVVTAIVQLEYFGRVAVTGRYDAGPTTDTPKPKVLSPEAERALAEADERRRLGEQP